MTYVYSKIPVLILVLVFLFMLSGCGDRNGFEGGSGFGSRKEILDLEELETAGQEAGAEESAAADESAADASGADSASASGAATDGTGASAEAAASGTSGSDASMQPDIADTCVVHICGAVSRPGVYTLPGGSRICDAVTAAGGLTEEASESSVNQAALLKDGVQIVIPTKEEAEAGMSGGITEGVTTGTGQAASDQPGSAQSAVGQTSGSLVNINSATLAELMTLPGIGQTRAEAIVAYREKQGSFTAIEDIMKVDGIKEGSFAKLKDHITVR